MEGHAELLALQRLDETCTQLQKQGNYLEALECMERGLVLRQHFFGPDSEEVWTACKTVGKFDLSFILCLPLSLFSIKFIDPSSTH